MFTFVPAEQLHSLQAARETMDKRMEDLQADLRRMGDAV
jgi:hypothetical protein